MTETWRPVPSLPDYEASDLGRIRSFRPKGEPGRILAGSVNRYGYVTYCLQDKPRRGHSLVLEAFLGPRPEGMVTRHLDGDKTNNTLANLTYGTQSENVLDEVRHGTHAEASKITCDQGHPLDAVRRDGRRFCRICKRQSDRARRVKRWAQGLTAHGTPRRKKDRRATA